MLGALRSIWPPPSGSSPPPPQSSAACIARRSAPAPPRCCARSGCGSLKIANGYFRAKLKESRFKDIKRFWEDVREKAELPAVRIHDLRHTFASLVVSGGVTLPMIGKLLGHMQVQTTQRYAHLLDDPLRAGLELVSDMLRAKPRIVTNAGP